jgi:hypothetical protein
MLTSNRKMITVLLFSSFFTASLSAATVTTPSTIPTTSFTAAAVNNRAATASQVVAKKNEVNALKTNKQVTDTTTNSVSKQINTLPSGQINTIIELASPTGPRITTRYSYFPNGDVLRMDRTQTTIFHGVPVSGTSTTHYGYDSKDRHVLTSLSGTDSNGTTTTGATAAYRYVQSNKREFTLTYTSGGLTKGYDILNSKGQVIEHRENTTFSGTFNPQFESVSTFKYDNNRVTEKIYRSRLVNGKLILACDVLSRKLPPNEVNDYDVVKKVQLIKTARFYFYDPNGVHLTITNYSYSHP